MSFAARLSSSGTISALVSILALAWIVTAHFFRHEGDTDPARVRLALSAMALWFLVCGVWTHARVRTTQSALFLLYCALSGLHWGGPIGVGPDPFRSVELAFFVIVGTVLTQSVFLDLARRLGAAARDSRPEAGWIPYAPALAGFLLLIIYAMEPREALMRAILMFYPIGVLLSLLGGVILIALPFRSTKQRFANSVVAAALFVGWAPHALVSNGIVAAIGNEGYFNLPLAIIPLALAWRIGSSRRV